VLDVVQADRDDLHTEWQSAADREKRSRTMFAQHAIKTDEVAGELEAARRAIGSSVDAESFLKEALTGYGALIKSAKGSAFTVNLEEVGASVRDAIKGHRDVKEFTARFSLPVEDGVLYLHRTHPIVEGLGGHVLDTALDPLLARGALARRAGVVRTSAVETRTTVLLLRLRFHILTARKTGEEKALLAEDCQVVAYRGGGASAEWLARDDAEKLLAATPSGNIAVEQARHFLERALGDLPSLAPGFEKLAHDHAARVLEAHERVRQATRAKGIRHRVEPKLPVDVVGVYVCLPAGA
jgi:hypothetical protein